MVCKEKMAWDFDSKILLQSANYMTSFHYAKSKRDVKSFSSKRPYEMAKRTELNRLKEKRSTQVREVPPQEQCQWLCNLMSVYVHLNI